MTIRSQLPAVRVARGLTDYWGMVRPTYIENWPYELRHLSIASGGMFLDGAEVEAMGLNQLELWETWTRNETPRRPPLDSIQHELTRVWQSVPNAGFIRLGSRSPKDSGRCFEHGLHVRSAVEGLVLLLNCSERVNDDLHLAHGNDYAPWIWVREWVDMEPWQEFRCFVYEKRLVGISQYWYDKPLPEVCVYADELERVITTYVNFDVIPLLHLDSAVVDVFVQKAETWRVTLLEINPFFRLTDPCLYNWYDTRSFDGRLRYVR